MQIQQNYNSHPVNLFNTIKIFPERIKHIFSSDNYLLVTRQTYSEIYNITYHREKIFFDELVRLQQCEYLYRIEGVVVIVKAFQIKFLGGEYSLNKIYPYSAQMKSAEIVNGKLYTHHLNGETRYWNIQDTTFEIVPTKHIPFHISSSGVKGYSRHIQGQFTAIHQNKTNLYFGDSQGYIHIYQTKFLTSIAKIKKHQGPILSIIQNNDIVYATGCDSKIICLKQINGKFVVTSSVRGQSHDILSICFIDNKTIVSGGLSTDLCYYNLVNGDFSGEYFNRPCLTSKRLVSTDNKKQMILVNQRKSLELWKYNLNQSSTQFLLKFQSKYIIEEAQLEQSGKWIAYSTVDELVVLKVEQDLSLTKHMTFKPSKYIRFLGYKMKILVYTTDGGIYLINLKNKTYKFIDSLKQLCFASDFDFNYPNLLVGSKTQEKVVIINMKQKKKQLIQSQFHLAQLHTKGWLINKNFGLDVYIEGQQRVLNLRIPLRKVRFGGIYPGANIWFGCGDGMLLMVKHLFNRNDKYFENNELPVKKKMGTKQTTRIFQTILSSKGIGLIPIDFKEMLQNIQNPIISKKVL